MKPRRPNTLLSDDGETVVFIIHSKHGDFHCRVDSADWPRVSDYHWTIDKPRGAATYARTQSNGNTNRRMYLHRFILLPPDGLKIDHINNDGLDCRRMNLRYASTAQNQMNQTAQVGADVPYKGVSRTKFGRFVASIKVNGKRKYLGSFRTAEQAARAYDKAARRYFRNFACPNFPEETPA